MITALFGNIKTGRLARLSYLGYSILITVLFFVLVLAIVLAIGAGEHVMRGDLDQAQEKLQAWFSLPLLIVIAVLFALLAFAGFNTMAKRIRDIGLPGWWGILAVIIAAALVSSAVSKEAGSGVHTLVWIALLLIPGGSFSRGTHAG